MSDFRQYEQLQKKVDLFFEETHQKLFDQIQCRKGCHQCCKPDLSVSIVEKEYIKHKMLTKKNEISKKSAANPHDGKRCAFLDKEGACMIYDARPLICRSHGIPIQVKEENHSIKRDVCELNFQTTDLQQLDTQSILNLDTLNTILAVINMQLYKEESESRYSLTPDSIFS